MSQLIGHCEACCQDATECDGLPPVVQAVLDAAVQWELAEGASMAGAWADLRGTRARLMATASAYRRERNKHEPGFWHKKPS